MKTKIQRIEEIMGKDVNYSDKDYGKLKTELD